MAELKTKVNDASVDAFLLGLADERKRQDCFAVLDIMRRATANAENVGRQHRGLRRVSLQVRQRSRRRLAADRLLRAPRTSRSISWPVLTSMMD